MKYILILLLLCTFELAAGTIEDQLRDTPEMSHQCAKNIKYFSNKIAEYNTKDKLTIGQKLKLQYYISELESWNDYCNPDNFGLGGED